MTLPASEKWREALCAQAVGFGRNATGGKGGELRVVDKLSDTGSGSLRDAMQTPGAAWVTFAVSGTITAASEIHPTSNKTVDGRGQNVVLANRGITVGTWNGPVTGPVTNVIVENISFEDTFGNCQLAVAENASDVWVDHCTLHDAVDEEIYVGSGSVKMSTHVAPLRVTISWCKFPAATAGQGWANKSFLVSDKGNVVDAATQITYHHNHFQTYVRHPLLLLATLHGFNNYFQRNEIGVQIRHRGKYLSENDIFESRPGNSYPMVKVDGYAPEGHLPADSVKVVGPLLLNGAKVEQVNAAGIFVPGYPYTLEAGDAALQARILAGAGWQAELSCEDQVGRLTGELAECRAANTLQSARIGELESAIAGYFDGVKGLAHTLE